ncbi:Uncharacterized protein APZ42_022248 [Daphnia magna]|uniref:Ethylmalonyl-CoA decarboxylase n=1 Tax=Daphnia magna TaxID=35525 RepID=A0A162C935_9CRUS|nr:Uncharacterized protein APZ42_022248 [Daphnia magna]
MSLRCISATAPITRLLKNSTSDIMSFNENRRWVNHYAGPDTSVSVICDQFSKFEGGKVELTKDDKSGVAVIKINHPERRNALSGSMMVNLWNAVNELEDWKSGKGIILHSVGETFCSGGDLNTVRQISNPDEGPDSRQSSRWRSRTSDSL